MSITTSERIKYLVIGMTLGALMLFTKISLEQEFGPDNCCPCTCTITTPWTGE